VTARFEKDRRSDRKTFYCPQGHPQSFRVGADEETRLRRELDRQRELREAEAARLQRVVLERDQIAKAHSKMRVRVMNGVCPCCNRTFQNLLRHMQTEHAGEVNLKTLRAAFGMTQAQVAREIGVYPAAISLHERGRPVARSALQAIDRWVSTQSPSSAAEIGRAEDGREP
jgi:DNA-binding XRE family transcriptional regulator